MPIVNERRYAAVPEFRAAEDTEDNQYIVRGYASTFEPYVLFHEGDKEIYEQIAPDAFKNADMSDVIMQYDHEGRVFARTKNETLKVGTDEHGLWMEADLSKTEGARSLYEDIKSGMITEMSFAFTVEKDNYNKGTCTRTIEAIRKVYDVSAVSIPANPGTEISARNYFNGVIEAEAEECRRADERNRKIAIAKLMLEVN